MKAMKKMLAGLLAAAVAVSCMVTAYAAAPSEVVPPAGTTAKNEKTEMAGGLTTSVNTSVTGIAALNSIAQTDKAKVKVSPYITVNGVKYTVTIIRKNAFANCAKAKKVTLPGTLTHIRKGAFTGAAALKNIIYNGRNSLDIQKGAFKGLATKKMVFRVNNKNMSFAEWAKLVNSLKAANFKGKIVAPVAV